MTYEKKNSTQHPGMILILVDQSYSMTEPFGSNLKMEVAADAVNKVIYELVMTCASGPLIKDRCYVEVIGYGETVQSELSGMISTIGQTPANMREVVVESNGNKFVEEQPIWIEAKANNGTPMEQAFALARASLQGWIYQHPDGFPPVVINITDGEPNLPDQTRAEARLLMDMQTNDGPVLLFNAHISNAGVDKLILPASPSVLSNEYARFLFDISSPLPEPLLKAAGTYGFKPQQGSRGFIFNADAGNLVKLLTFGSVGTVFLR